MDLPEDIRASEQQAIAWLNERVTPNQEIPDPTALRRRLIQSYVIDPENPSYPWIFHRSYIYDNALAVIAFTILEDYQSAELVLSALYRNLQPDGSLFFAYNTRNNWPYPEDPQGAQIRSGALAWVGYSAVFYLSQRVAEDPWFLEEDILAGDILDMALRIGGYLKDRQVVYPEDPRFGMVTGGWGTHKLVLNDQEITEEFIPGPLSWVSMEHNVDCYYLFRDLGILTADTQWKDAAEILSRGLLTLWSSQAKQFYRGVRLETGLDQSLPLDGASWGYLFLYSIGDQRKEHLILQNIDKVFLSEGQYRGYRPYGDEYVYESYQINHSYFPQDPPVKWKDLDFVWTEGSLGVAAAYVRANREEDAIEILRDSIALMEQGGIRYASEAVDYQFNKDPSVASTAWFIMVAEMLKGNPRAGRFWDRDKP